MRTTEWIKQNRPTFSWRVRSKSEPGWYHIVDYYSDSDSFVCEFKTNGKIKKPCLCEMGRKKRGTPCRHIRIVQNHFKGLKYNGENYKLKRNKIRQES